MTDQITPAELARELGVSPKRIRDFLRAKYGLLQTRLETRWLLSPAQADDVRAHFGG